MSSQQDAKMCTPSLQASCENIDVVEIKTKLYKK